jgi:hypothetical protein
MPVVTSAPSEVKSTAIEAADWWLKDPDNPANNVILMVARAEPMINESSATYRPLGRKNPITIHEDKVIGSYSISLTVETLNRAQHDKLMNILLLRKTLLLQSPFNEQWYIRLTDKFPVRYAGAASDPIREIVIRGEEVDPTNV